MIKNVLGRLLMERLRFRINSETLIKSKKALNRISNSKNNNNAAVIIVIVVVIIVVLSLFLR
jgi:hypothetical protein